MNCLKSFSIVLVGVMLLVGPLAPTAWAEPWSPAPWIHREQDSPKESDGKRMGAAVVNVVHVPGKFITCTITAVVGFVALVITLGSGYETVAGMVREGCGGPWVITPDDLEGPDFSMPDR